MVGTQSFQIWTNFRNGETYETYTKLHVTTYETQNKGWQRSLEGGDPFLFCRIKMARKIWGTLI